MSNTELWDKLGKTDPAHTKAFQRTGGFKGTAIKPMFSYKRMTEEFGPCGKGWGIDQPKFDVVSAGDEVLVYCTVSIWYGSDPDMSVFGVGGDKVYGKNSKGLFSDDEAFKKAYTDAVTNALKLIGVGADVHMGMFDDSKYVNDMSAHFAEEKKPEDKFSPENKSFQADVITKIALCITPNQLGELWNEINEGFEKLPDDMKRLIQQADENRRIQMDNGITPVVASHKFAGVKDAIAWLNKMQPVVTNFKSSKMLLDWQTYNQPWINGLSCLSAKDYEKNGKLPKERFTDALKAKYEELSNIELSQQQIAAE